MSIDTQERLERRVAELAVNDPEFAAARPDEAVSAAIEAAGRRLPQVAKAVLEGYSDRPALAQRAVELVKDPQTGRTSAKLLPWFDKVTYGELADRVDALSRALTNGADGIVAAGDRVCVLGFTSVDYTTIDIALGLVGAVSVPLQTSAAVAQLQPIVIETEPTVFAASVDYLSDAVDVILNAAEAGHTPGRLVVFDYRTEVDDHRAALQTAHERLAELALTIETLNEVRERGAGLPAAHRRRARRGRPAGPADLHLGQHRRAQGRDVPAEQRRQDVEQVDQELDRAKCRVDHPELHADEPRHGPRQPLRHAR